MRPLFVRWLGVFVLLALIEVPTGWAQGNMGPPPLPSGEVVEIEIVGTRRVEPLAVRNIIGTEVGENLDRDQLRRDIFAIRRLRTGGIPFCCQRRACRQAVASTHSPIGSIRPDSSAAFMKTFGRNTP